MRLALVLALLIAPVAVEAEPRALPDGAAAALEAGDIGVALMILRPAADACEAEQPDDDRCMLLFTMTAMLDVAMTASVGGDRELEAGRTVPRFHAYARRHGGADPSALGLAAKLLGIVRTFEWRYPEAEDAFREAHAAMSKVVPPEPDEMTQILLGLANAIAYQRLERDATPYYRELLNMARVQPADHGLLRKALAALGANLDRLEAHVEAEDLFREALALSIRVHGEGSVETAQPIANLALNQERQGRLDAADAMFRQAIAIFEAKGVPEAAEVIRVSLAHNLVARGRYGEAEPIARARYDRVLHQEIDQPGRIDASMLLGRVWSYIPAQRAGARMLLRDAVQGTHALAAEKAGYDGEAQRIVELARPAALRAVAVAWALAHR